MLNDLAVEVREIRESKGFITPDSIYGASGEQMLGKLMLVVTEVAEAAEAVRHGDGANFAEELADVIIRVLDICAAVGIDIDAVIQEKMEANRKRPAKHGKKSNL
jgi:NTP pyrophosphatase (non-canonical NTP hydrolase)